MINKYVRIVNKIVYCEKVVNKRELEEELKKENVPLIKINAIMKIILKLRKEKIE